MSDQETRTIPVRSAGTIISQTEELAAVLMKNIFQREAAEAGFLFHESECPRAKHCWRLACEIQEMLTDTDPDDALSELGEDEPGDTTMPEPSTFLVIQEGGSSQELYTHVFDNRDDADAYRTSSADEGSYRTSSPIEVPLSLADHPAFGCVAEAIAKGAVSVDFPEDD
ncbi:hypothetical protein [Pigmentiphaga kullae]|uniref:hypothetical protein n=1 Tax=Pigmentiphaga kullae TaxID=151784 RepID=UPI00102C46F2|nr:hypothetical protein [Pigmentiphaga kullae]